MKLAWQSVTRETIVKSFVVCGISGNVDGSEDGRVKCLKSDGIAPEAREAIAEQTNALSSAAEIEQDNDDPFSEDEEEEISECVIIDDTEEGVVMDSVEECAVIDDATVDSP